MIECWNADPNKRPTIQEVVESLKAIDFESNNRINSNAYMENKIELFQEIDIERIHISSSTNGSHNSQLYLNELMYDNGYNSDVLDQAENISVSSDNELDRTEALTLRNIRRRRRERRHKIYERIEALPRFDTNNPFINQIFYGSPFLSKESRDNLI